MYDFVQLFNKLAKTRYHTNISSFFFLNSLSENRNSFEIIQHFNSTHIFIWVRKLDFDSLAGAKNWSSWNEIIETSGRLHPLRPQNKNSIRKELRITSILDKIDEYRKKWLLHIQKMPQNRIPLKSYNYRPQGRRSIGRPNKLWRKQL